jgi:hypothetical protein
MIQQSTNIRRKTSVEKLLQPGVEGEIRRCQYYVLPKNACLLACPFMWALTLHSHGEQVGTSETANGVYWRSRKVLGDSTALTAPSS